MSGQGADNGVSVTAEALITLRHIMLQQQVDQSISALPGGFAIARRGNGQVIADSRIYIQGDDIRHVDRGATARTGELHIRTFHEERDRVTFLVADFRPCMLWGMRRALRSVAAAEALAWLGWQAVQAGGRVGLLAVTANERVHVASRPRVRGMLGVIGGLVRAHAQAVEAAAQGLSDPPLDAALTGLSRLAPRGAEVVIASALDSRGAGLNALIGELARHRSPRFLVIGESALRNLPVGTYPMGRPDGTRVRAHYAGQGGMQTSLGPEIERYPVDHVDAGRALPHALSGMDV